MNGDGCGTVTDADKRNEKVSLDYVKNMKISNGYLWFGTEAIIALDKICSISRYKASKWRTLISTNGDPVDAIMVCANVDQVLKKFKELIKKYDKG